MSEPAQTLEARLLKAASAIYVAVDKEVADSISGLLQEASNAIAAARAEALEDGWQNFYERQRARYQQIIAHIRKELVEIENNPSDIEEWIDVMMLAFDGAQRLGATTAEILNALKSKQRKNMERQWSVPADPDEPIEHVRALKERP